MIDKAVGKCKWIQVTSSKNYNRKADVPAIIYHSFIIQNTEAPNYIIEYIQHSLPRGPTYLEHLSQEDNDKIKFKDKNKVTKVPQIDHDHNELGTCSGNL